ncbi:WD40 repeat-like protein [Panus rudis PR-1116 ss-1]|nr:WD40 repeat-like protein [Panus rudis PR-1116 ss-1]
MTGWADDIIEEDPDEGEDYRSAGDILGEVKGSNLRARWKSRSGSDHDIPYEQQWETDIELYESKVRSPGASQFRQSAQVHSDWINDILLCNLNQTVVTASSDGTVKAWNPNVPSEPTVLGTHADYVKCLTHSRAQNWVASGSFDRSIKLWDLSGHSGQGSEPLITMHPPDASVSKASIYALATDPLGSIIVSGSPERVVRMWDPRAGKRVGKLVGHTDNIRAILLSEDGRYMLTGSADASIKLWSLSSQRCLHTFTYQTESVWSLFSSHPSLEIFYSGDRSGLVCKVDVEGCSDISEGECVVLCQDTGERALSSADGINKIVAMDDNLLWTASGNSSIKRWKVPPRRATRAGQLGGIRDADSPFTSESAPDYSPHSNSPRRRSADYTRSRSPHRPTSKPSSPSTRGHRSSIAPSVHGSVTSETSAYNQDREGEETWYGIPYESLVKLTSPNETFTTLGMSRGRDPEIATLYSAASIVSVPRLARSPLSAAFLAQQPRSISPVLGDTAHTPSRYGEETLHPIRTARMEYEEREVAADAIPLNTTPDEVIHGDHGLVRCVVLNDRMHALTVNTAGEVAVWDIVRGICLGMYNNDDVAAASFCGSSSSSSGGEKEFSPREALEAVRERIEGEAVVLPWATVDTKMGVLSVHLNERCFEAEIYADEAGYGSERQFSDDVRLNIGKWVLRNLFASFIKEQVRSSARRVREHANQESARLHRGSAPTHIDLESRSTGSRGRSSSDASRTSTYRSPTIVTSPNIVPAAPPASTTPRMSPLMTPTAHTSGFHRDTLLSPIPQSPNSSDATPMPRAARPQTTDGSNSSRDDYFSLRTPRPSTAGVGTPDELGARTSSETPLPPTPSTPSVGFMGRLRAFGKGSRRQTGETGATTPGTPSTEVESTLVSHSGSVVLPKTPLQVLLSNPLSPPSSNDAPPLALPPNTSIIISQESASGWTNLYRGLVTNVGHDARALSESMPVWLLEYLLINKVPTTPVTKLSFVLLPFPNKDPHGEQLPELLNTAQSKLTASRFLRVRKLTHHVQDKLDKIAGGRVTVVNTPRSSFEGRPVTLVNRIADSRPPPEELFEIICNDTVLPLNMTLAAVRQYVWRQSGELIMYYRKRHVE